MHAGFVALVAAARLPFAVGDSAFGEIVGRQFHLDLVTREDLDEVHSHPPADVAQDYVSCLELHSKSRVGEALLDHPLDPDWLLFGQTLDSP